jgi:hypothetical protein
MSIRLTLGPLASCVWVTFASAATVPAEVYKHPQELVSVGTRRLNVYRVGTGKPTVLLDSGSGNTMLPWHLVQLQIAAFTRVQSEPFMPPDGFLGRLASESAKRTSSFNQSWRGRRRVDRGVEFAGRG